MKSNNKMLLDLLVDSDEEKQKKKVAQKRQRLRSLLTIPLEDRNEEHLREIAKLVKSVPFYAPYANHPDFLEICKNLQLQRFDSKTIICRQGEKGTTFYVILTGKVSVMINIPSETKGVTNWKEVAQLSEGGSFGEIALHFDSVRTASIITLETTECILLEKKPFQQFIKAPKNELLENISSFLETVQPLSFLSKKQLVTLSTKATVKKFNTDVVVVKQGTWATTICFVKSGRLKIVRNVLFRVDTTTKELNDDVRDPLAAEIDTGIFRAIDLELDEIGKGDFFSDRAAFQREKVEYTAISIIPCQIILISLEDFKEVVPPEIIKLFKTQYSKPYPDDEILREKYYARLEWNSMREDLLKDALYYNVKNLDQRSKLMRRLDKLQAMRANSVPKKRGDLAIGVSLIQNIVQNKVENLLKDAGANFSADSQASQDDKRVSKSNTVNRLSKGASANQSDALPPIRKESVGKFTNR